MNEEEDETFNQEEIKIIGKNEPQILSNLNSRKKSITKEFKQ